MNWFQWLLPTVAMLSFAVPAAASDHDPIVLDDFESLAGWRVIKTEGVRLEIAHDKGVKGAAMRLDFDFGSGAGYALVRKEMPLPLPPNYEFQFQIRGEAPDNNFEFKLVDGSGKNVWWVNRRDFAFPKAWETNVIKKRHLQFAWGPLGGEPEDIAAIEVAITAGSGGKGSIWLDELSLQRRPPSSGDLPEIIVNASITAEGSVAAHAVDGDGDTAWRSGAIAEDQWIELDFQERRVYGAVVVDWDSADFARDYTLETSDDGEAWQQQVSVESSNGGRDYLHLPDTESRFLRFNLRRSSQAKGYAIRSIDVKPYDAAITLNRFFEMISRSAQPGTYPKYFSRQQSYWTIVGAADGGKEALINEEGALEVDHGAFSIEPFLYRDGALVTWHDVATRHSLQNDYLPIPTVTWQTQNLKLHVTAWTSGKDADSVLHARYRLESTGTEAQAVKLFLAIRPFQVNPPWQDLNIPGGVARIERIAMDGDRIAVNDGKWIQVLTPPDGFGATAFYQGDITEFLSQGGLPAADALEDPFKHASAALEYEFNLSGNTTEDVFLAIPFSAPDPDAATRLVEAAVGGGQPAGESLERAIDDWTRLLDRASLRIPGDDNRIEHTLKSTIAYILIHQDGPAIQPGSRSYERSWIRDGALTSRALLEMGYAGQVREFIQWFAANQFDSGKVPCCVDHRGADPIPEHDSHGAFIYLVMEYYRFTRDIGLARQTWPQVVKAVEYIDGLRRQRKTEEYDTPEKRAYRGLLPESISHEGYASNPVHSYWDDFFAVRGLKDAADLARILGEDEYRIRFERIHDEFRQDLHNSIVETMKAHGLDFIPGAVELGDFDAPSTAIGLVPGEQLDNLPLAAWRDTFEKYYRYFLARRAGTLDWDNYSPYEARVMGAYVRLDEPERAWELMRFLLADQRPAGWNSWGEIVWRDPRAPRYVGDMPHTWVASEFIRAIRSMFVYERLSDDSLVLAAGLPADWVTAPGGVQVKRLPTYYGTLNYTLRSPADDRLVLHLDGDVRMGSGSIELHSPLTRPIVGATVNGKDIDAFDDRRVVIDEFPADVEIRY